MSRKHRKYTVDGGVSTGKSQLGADMAEALGCSFWDAGISYRMYAVLAMRMGKENIPALIKAFNGLDIVIKNRRVLVDDADLTDTLTLEDVGKLSAEFSPIPEIRTSAHELEFRKCEEGDLVMAGRHCYPTLSKKYGSDDVFGIYLEARPEVAAKRRFDQLIGWGRKVSALDVYQDYLDRERKDKSRSLEPLGWVEGMVRLDNSDLTIPQTLQEALKLSMQYRAALSWR